MDVKELNKVKKFILWAKQNGIEQIKYGDIAVVFRAPSPLDTLSDAADQMELSSEVVSKVNKIKEPDTEPEVVNTPINNDIPENVSKLTNEDSEENEPDDEDEFFSDEAQPKEDPMLYWSSEE